MTRIKSTPGAPHPLGATLRDGGVNFALFSEHATGVDLCLYSDNGDNRETRVRMTERTDHVWHAFLPGIRAGQRYGYRVYGPHAPERGMRFNPAKLLLDPYARAITGKIRWNDRVFPYPLHQSEQDLDRDYRNNAADLPRCLVMDPAFDWGGDQPPRVPMEESVIYEVHVKGFTKRMEAIPENLRGTYAGLGTPEATGYLRELGVTAVSLLPVQEFIHDRVLIDRGLSNYWGYNTIGYFAPESGYALSPENGGQVTEFKEMVKNLHAAGLEVILDVVYNHTGEGNHLGPALSFRGIDNPSYYRLLDDQPRYNMDFTGCGNSWNVGHPRALQLIMDSLRYWVQEMRVDGFRFDLATTLARDNHHYDRGAAFLDILRQDPVLSQVKLIAEPWDIGEGGYQVGNFPSGWSEWNGKFRDTVRSYWKGDDGRLGKFAWRLSGSPDLYQAGGRSPRASVNFITAHDGFTLHDLVSYNEKHNEANGEDNRDGHHDNLSWNCGAEGDTDDAEINRLRRRQRRNFLATLFLAQGVPMLCAGDEYGRSQQGNNNAYCQDNELSWLHWERDEEQVKLTEFTRGLIRIRRQHPVFRRPGFFRGRPARGADWKDMMWYNPDGKEMSESDWHVHFASCVGMLICGQGSAFIDQEGNPVQDGTFLLLFNAHYEEIPFRLPGEKTVQWKLLINTFLEEGLASGKEILTGGQTAALEPRAFRLFEQVKTDKSK